MPSQEDIQFQLDLLAQHRKTLAIYLKQIASSGSQNAPPSVLNGVQEARDYIKDIKKTLRDWNVLVEDNPIDEEGVILSPSLLPISTQYQEALTKVLFPLKDILEQTRKISQALLGDYITLEYDPRELKAYFTSLPDTDRRRLYWKQRINRLRKYNQQALDLINNYQIILERFRNAVAAFRYHADEWEDVWNAVADVTITADNEEVNLDSPLSYVLDIRGETVATQFPAELEPALQDEITEVKRRVGLP